MFKQKKRRSREFKNSDKVIDLEQARFERRQRRQEATLKKQGKSAKDYARELSERKVNRRNRKRLIYGMVIFGITMILGVSVFHVYSLQQEYKDVAAQKKTLELEKNRLTEELGNVNNPEYIEQQARDQLKMVRQGEVLYILPASETTGTAVTPAQSHELLPAGEASD